MTPTGTSASNPRCETLLKRPGCWSSLCPAPMTTLLTQLILNPRQAKTRWTLTLAIIRLENLLRVHMVILIDGTYSGSAIADAASLGQATEFRSDALLFPTMRLSRNRNTSTYNLVIRHLSPSTRLTL